MVGTNEHELKSALGKTADSSLCHSSIASLCHSSRASIVCNVMLLTFILKLSFRSPISEENAVSVRNDTRRATSSCNGYMYGYNGYMYGNTFSIKIFKLTNLNPSATLLSNQFCDSSRH